MNFFKISILAVLLYCTLSSAFEFGESENTYEIDDRSDIREKISALVDKLGGKSSEFKQKLKDALISAIEHGKPLAKEFWVEAKPILKELAKASIKYAPTILKLILSIAGKREVEIDDRSDIREKISALVDKLGGKSSEFKQKLKDALISAIENGKPLAKEFWTEAKPILTELAKASIKYAPTILSLILSIAGKREIEEMRFNLIDKVTSLVDKAKLKEKVSAIVDKLVHLSKEAKEKLKPVILDFIEFGKPIAKELFDEVKPILIELVKQKLLAQGKREVEIDDRSDIREKISALVDKLHGKTSDFKQKLKDALVSAIEHGKPLAKEFWTEAKPILKELAKTSIKLAPIILPIILSLAGKREIEEMRFNLIDKVTSLVDKAKLKEKVSAIVDKLVHLSKEAKEKLKPVILDFIEFGKPIAKELWVEVKPILIELMKQKILGN